MLYKSFTLKKYSLPQKIIAGALAFGLIPLMGTADVSAKPSPNQDKIMKPAGWSCDAPYIACQRMKPYRYRQKKADTQYTERHMTNQQVS